MEMWAGFECTLNRVGDRFQDQLLPTERKKRTHCLESLPALGVTAFRYRIAWDDVSTPWDTVAQDIALLTSHNIKPIIGLLHHGSGPADTSLISDNFIDGMGHMPAKSHASCLQSNIGPPSMNRSPPLVFQRFTGIGIRTIAMRCRFGPHSSIRLKQPSPLCAKSGW